MKPTFDHSQALKMMKKGVPIAKVAEHFKVQKQTIYAILRTQGISIGVRRQLRNSRIMGETDRIVERKSFTGDLDDHRYVRRDPCLKCGVRGDIGCKHFPKGADQ